ncbi:MAG: four helix bundle protein [Candidatus Omnitrophota bacterium]
MKKYLLLEDISSYKISFSLSNYIWDIVTKWDYFAKRTVGQQLVESVDSISANIAEGFGRYFKKDKINFYRYSFGSLKESFDWINKAEKRKLLTKEQCEYITKELNKLPVEINHLISYTDTKLTK